MQVLSVINTGRAVCNESCSHGSESTWGKSAGFNSVTRPHLTLFENVYISGAFSVSEEDYQIILKELERQFTISINNQTQKLKEVQDKLIQFSK